MVIQIPDVFFRDILLHLAPTVPDVVHQPLDAALQVHDKIRSRDIPFDSREKRFVELELFVGQREIGKNLVFLEDVVGNQEVVEQFLSRHPAFKLESERELLPFVDDVDGAYVARMKLL